MTIDILTAGVGFLSFVFFLLVHVALFRRVRPESLLKSLLSCVLVMLAFPVVLMAISFHLKTVDAPMDGWVCGTLLAVLLQGLLCFVYVLCIFGPYETSVRMRLIREIAKKGPGGISHQDLLGRYNDQTIVDVRLRRLVGSGDIIEKNGRYQASNKKNLFFVFDAIAGILKKWIGR